MIIPSNNISGDGPAFSAGLLGTQELVNNAVVGGMDWFYRDDSPEIFPTTQTGSQITTWWSQTDGNSTYIHVTNTAEDDPNCDDDSDESTQYVHVVVLDESCNELINFCDVYTPEDSHIYDLDAIVTNAGNPQGSSALDGKEGIFVLTATTDCTQNPVLYPVDEHNFFAATVRVINDLDTDYGFNAYARAFGGDTTGSNACDGGGLDNIGTAGSNLVTLEKDFNTVTQTTAPTDDGLGQAGAGVAGSNDAVAAGDIILMNYTDDYDFTGNSSYRPLAAITNYNAPVMYDHKELDASCPAFSGCFTHVGINLNLPTDTTFDIAPPAEDCAVEGDEDGDGAADCADSDCIGAAPCESGDQCADGADNDGVNGTDCADPGCDGAAGTGGTCEAGTETTCDDDFDNDGDGLTDGDDPDCQTTGDDDDDDDSGGCSLVGSSSAGTAAVNVLLPMMVFGLGFGLRRMRRRD